MQQGEFDFRQSLVCYHCLQGHSSGQVLEEKSVNTETLYHEIYNEAVTLAGKVGISPSVPRSCGRLTQRANTSSSSVDEFFRRTITVLLFGYLLLQVAERFTTLQERASLALRLVQPAPEEFTAASLEFFQSDIPSPPTLQTGIGCWRHSWKSDAHLPLGIASDLKYEYVSQRP
jgi:hypothetical protein